MTQDDILDSHNWIKQMKELHGEKDNQDEEEIKCPDKDQLNFKQKIAYDLIEEFVNEKMTVEGKDVTLYLNISGKAGCGKSAVVKCISKYIRSKTKPSFMKIGAPTGTAAFLVKGSTLHTLFQLPINNLKGKMPEIKGDRLRDLQKRFEDVELLVIDEKSMIGQYMLYMIEERLRQAKPSKSDLPFGGVYILGTMDNSQIKPINQIPFLTSTLVLTCFLALELKHSVRAHNDIDFQQLQSITKMDPFDLEHDMETKNELPRGRLGNKFGMDKF